MPGVCARECPDSHRVGKYSRGSFRDRRDRWPNRCGGRAGRWGDRGPRARPGARCRARLGRQRFVSILSTARRSAHDRANANERERHLSRARRWRTETMRVLFCVSEAVPLAKTGGLADVGGALPAALTALGTDVRVVLPRYRGIDSTGWREVGAVDVSLGAKRLPVTVLDGQMPESGVPAWLIDQPQLFDRAGLYGEGGQDYPDNLLRFTCLCRGMLAWLERQPWQPDIIHCHDWQTALVPAIIAARQARRAATLLTIHNLAYQGLFPSKQFEVTGLPPSMYTIAGLEFWGQVNLLKGGLVFADLLNTVSETYAQEIQTAEFGAGLDGVLRDRSRDLFGILNGVDYSVWDPAQDPLMPSRYEPSGLNQLYSLRYGTVPIVRRTGGLADSIRDATPQALRAGTANGFVFADYTPQALLQAAQRALAAFRDAATWRTLQRTGMTADFSWAAAAKKYVGLYERAMARSHDRARAG